MKDNSDAASSSIEGTLTTRPSAARPTRSGDPGALLGALVLAVGLLGVAWMGPTRAMVGWALLPWTGAFLGLITLHRSGACWLNRSLVLLAGSLGLRLLFLATDQDLSDDLYRYVWDGWLRLQGIRPYRWPPEDPALADFHGDILFQEMNSSSWISIYPPLSQLVFLASGWLHARDGWPTSALGIRIGFTTLEFLGVLALHRALRVVGARPALLILYAWNPLVLLAVAGSGHSEGGLVLGLGVLLLGVARGQPYLAWMGWILAVLAKGIPLLLAPLLFRTLTERAGLRQTLVGMLPAGIFGLSLSAFFLGAADIPRILTSVRLYTDVFSFNGALHPLFRALGWRFLGLETGPFLARLFVLTTVTAALLIALLRPWARANPTRGFATGALGLMALYLILTPTVHPWYLLWGLPLLPLAAPSVAGPWLWMSWAGLSTYLFYAGFEGAPLAVFFWAGALVVALATLHVQREQVLAPLRQVAGRRKAGWIRPWVSGARVLDVGGGEGHVLRALGPPSGWVIDPESVQPGHVRALGEALPFKDGSVDTVVLSFVLHHAQDPRSVLIEALRVSRQRVVILESVPRSPLERRFLEGVDRWVNAHRGGGGMGRPEAPLAMQGANDWIRLARELGATVMHAGRPGGVHPILLLVLESGRAQGGESGRAQGGEFTQARGGAVDSPVVLIEDAS